MSDEAFAWLTSDQIYTRKRKSGVSSVEILALPDHLRQLVNHIMRYEPVRLEELVERLNWSSDDVRGQVALLTAQGWLQTEEIKGENYYRVHLAHRRTRSLPPGVWQVLEGTWKMQLFRHFNDDEKADFTRAFKLEHFQVDHKLFERGDWGHTMYLVEVGVIELVTQDVDGKPVVLERFKPGDVIGEVAVLLGERHWATARAVEPVSAWTLHKDDLDQFLARSPSAGISVQREIERGVHGLERQISTPLASSLSHKERAEIDKKLNPILVVGSGVMELARTLSSYSGERILVLDVHPVAQQSHLHPRHRRADAGQVCAQAPLGVGQDTDPGRVENRPAHDLDSKELTIALRQGLDQFERVFVSAPAELHGPLMSIVSQIELVIDLSDAAPTGRYAEVPWIIAAARRRWTIPALRQTQDTAGRTPRAEIEYLARRLSRRVVGLALSGGAARTLAHIGALRALEEAQIPIDMIASTGMGAVIAALYAAGFSVDELTDLATRRERDLNPFDGSLSLRLASRSALYAGKRARNALGKIIKDRTFADLRPSLYVVAADLGGEPVIFDQGPLINAVHASLSLAGLVAPAELQGRLLVDGGLINPMPASVLLDIEHNADIIIGISTIPNPASQKQEQADLTSTWLRLRDQLAHTALMNSLRHLDTLIMPQVDQFDGTAFDHAADLIAAGLTATQQEVDYIQTLLAPDA